MRAESALEVQKGRARGPFTAEDLDVTLGPRWVGCKRFGLRQGEKIRPIDDYSDSCVNSCVTVRDKIPLSDVDWVCSVARCWALVLGTDAQTTVQDTEGGSVTIKPHAEWQSCGVELHGGCFDLDAAYKQFPIHPDHHHMAVFGVADDSIEDGVAWYRALSLPFGDTGSVWQFNRAAVAFRRLLARLLCLPAGSFAPSPRKRCCPN